MYTKFTLLNHGLKELIFLADYWASLGNRASFEYWHQLGYQGQCVLNLGCGLSNLQPEAQSLI